MSLVQAVATAALAGDFAACRLAMADHLTALEAADAVPYSS